MDCPRVCIFDIDNTLTHGATAKCKSPIDDVPPSWPESGGTTADVKRMISQCVKKGYHIAIATSESGMEQGLRYENKTQHDFIRSLDPTADNSVFNDSFFASEAFQGSCSVVKAIDRTGVPWCRDNEYHRKETMIQNILNFYHVTPDCARYSYFFDDSVTHVATASSMGLKVVQSSPECGGVYCSEGCGIPALHLVL